MSANESILVVGGSKGIGRALVRHAASRGAEVTVTGRDAEKLKQTFDAEPLISVLAFDISDTDAIASALTGKCFDHVAILAGSARPGPLETAGVEEINQLLRERLVGPTQVVKALAGSRRLKSVTLTSGMSSVRPMKQAGGIFSATLSGVEGLARGLAIELAPIRVNAVRVGWVESDRHLAVEGGREAFYQKLASAIPVGHVGDPKDAAAVYYHLMRNAYINGQVIVLDGGLSGV